MVGGASASATLGKQVVCGWRREVLRGLELQPTSCWATLGGAAAGGPFCEQGALARWAGLRFPHRGPPGTDSPRGAVGAGKSGLSVPPLDWGLIAAQGALPFTRGYPVLVLVPMGPC